MAKGVNIADKEIEYATAITLTGGFGKYQRNLVLKMLPIALSSMMVVNTIPFVMPALVCEFGVSKYQQGMLLSSVYIGMVLGGFLWGVISDTIGRRRTLLFVLTSTTFFEFLSSFAINYWFLFGCKVLAGFTACGFLTTCYTYASEFVDVVHKDTMLLRTGTAVALAFFLQPLLGAIIIPLKIRYVIVPDLILIESWKLFIIGCSMLPFLGLLSTLCLLDESPAFLLDIGQPEKSLEILKEIYSTNTGKPRETFPVRKLAPSKPIHDEEDNKSLMSRLKPLLRYPYVIPVSIAYASQAVTLAAFNAIKLYQSMLFTLALGIGQKPSANVTDPESKTFCSLFQTQEIFKSHLTCEQQKITLDARIYLCSVVIGFHIFISLFFTKILIEKYNKIVLFVIGHLISAICMIIFPYGNVLYLLFLMSIFFVCMQNCTVISISLVVNRVPPSVRGVSVGLIMVFGRFGVILGSQILPLVSDLSCISTFWCLTFIHLLVVPLMIIYSRQPSPFEDNERRLSEEAEALRHLLEPN